MKNFLRYFSEVRLELTKVVWPKKEEVIRLTLMVFTVSAVFGLYLGLLDLSFTKLIEKLLTL